MALLFTSFYCPHCEKKEQTISASPQYPYTGYIAKSDIFADSEIFGKRAKLFETVEELRKFYKNESAVHGSHFAYSILKVYSPYCLSFFTKSRFFYTIVEGTPGENEVALVGEVAC
jgi:hypothetical protein